MAMPRWPASHRGGKVAAVTGGAALAARLEAGLAENFHYGWCRRVGQLGPPRVVPVPGGPGDLRQVRAQRLAAAGSRLGTVTFPPLTPLRDWEHWCPLSALGPCLPDPQPDALPPPGPDPGSGQGNA